jgi:DNA ligase-associated metallophosphoesterase
MTITILDHTFKLLPERALHWLDTSTLIVTDLHLGKSGHFRKSGIAAPQQINQANMRRLDALVNREQPDRLLILGDLFHSDVNREWFQFEEWRTAHNQLEITLIAGNHDSLHASFYSAVRLNVYDELIENNFRFIHDSSEKVFPSSEFIFTGHVHPGIKLKGKGRQSLRLPCFYQKTQQFILPAFGEFTGLYLLPEKDAELIYPIADSKVFQLNRA